MDSVIILGSSRSDGNTRVICDYLAEFSKAPIFDLNTYKIGYYDYNGKNIHDDFIPLLEKLVGFKTILFATPVYWYTMSAQMKTFLDRFSDLLKLRKDLGRKLRGINMKVICCSSDEEEYPEFWKPFQRSSEYLGMNYLGHAHTWLEEGQIPDDVKNRLIHLLK